MKNGETSDPNQKIFVFFSSNFGVVLFLWLVYRVSFPTWDFCWCFDGMNIEKHFTWEFLGESHHLTWGWWFRPWFAYLAWLWKNCWAWYEITVDFYHYCGNLWSSYRCKVYSFLQVLLVCHTSRAMMPYYSDLPCDTWFVFYGTWFTKLSRPICNSRALMKLLACV